MPLAEALEFGAQIADAIGTADRQGILHRDLKPANIMLTRNGAKLLDFGLAKLKAMPAVSGIAQASDTTSTVPATVLGTFPYMAPEQLEEKETDARTDLFAFGAVLYEMLTGKRAFDGDSPASVAAVILEHEPPSLSSLLPAIPQRQS